jgi:hypothetical protein
MLTLPASFRRLEVVYCSPPKNRKPWTVEEELLVANSLSEGKTLAEVAHLVGRSQSAVHCRALSIGVRTKTRTGRPPGPARKTVTEFFLS